MAARFQAIRIIAALQTIDFLIIVSQALVQRRAFQRAVVHVDADGLAVVKEEHAPAAPVFLVKGDTKDSILIRHPFEHKLAFGYDDAVHHFGGQLVFQIDRLAVFLADTFDGVPHLLSLSWLLCLCRHSQQQGE